MSNYNSTLQSNNIDLQAILNSINELPEAGGEPILQDKTVTPSTNKQTITADSGYDGLDTVTVNAMPTATQATPTITVDSSTGLITATATQTAGYVAAGTKSGTKQLAFQPAQIITPTTTNQTIPANTYLGGTQTIKGDANLIAENIKSGISIFGIDGSYEGSGGSSGGDVETCTITFSCSSSVRNAWIIKYDDDWEPISVYIGEYEGINTTTIEVAKNSIIAVSYPQDDKDYLYYEENLGQGCNILYDCVEGPYSVIICAITDNTTIHILSLYDEE